MISGIGLGCIVFGLIIDKFCNFFFFFGDLWCEVWKMKAWVLWSVSNLPCINENGLAMICNFVISDVKLGIFLFIFLILIRSRFRAFRLGLEGGPLDRLAGPVGPSWGGSRPWKKNPVSKRAESRPWVLACRSSPGM